MTFCRSLPYLSAFTATFCLALIVLWTLTSLEKAWFLDPEYGMWDAKSHMIENNCYDDDVVVLGDSRAMAGYIPSLLGDNVVNLAMGGANAIETYYEAEKMLAHCHTLPKKIVLSMAAFHLMSSDIFWWRSVRFSFLSFKEIEDVRASSVAIYDYYLFPNSMPLRMSSASNQMDARIRVFLDEIHFPTSYFASFREALEDWLQGKDRYKKNKRFYAEVLRDRGHHSFGVNEPVDKPSQEGNFPTFGEVPIMTFYLDRFLTLCAQNGTDVYYLAPPYTTKTSEFITDSFKEQTALYLEREANKHPNFHVVGDVFPILPNEKFGDIGHLNKEGAIEWSQRSLPFFALLGAHFSQ